MKGHLWAIVLLAAPAWAQTAEPAAALTEFWDPEVTVVAPGKTAGDAPADAIVLIGKGVELNTLWRSDKTKKVAWTLKGDVLTVKPDSGNLFTRRNFGSVQVHLKNGWVQFKSTDGLWAVNSMGRVLGDGRDYRLAVMTRVPDFATGRELTSEVGRQVFSILGSGSL